MPKRNSKVEEKWQALLNPEQLRTSLLIMGVFIAVFELLRERIESHLKFFFKEGFDKTGPIIGQRYRDKVLALHKNQTRAALLWFVNVSALTDNDLSTFDRVRKLRNEIAHEMFDRFGPRDIFRYAEELANLLALLRKVEVWWTINVELPTDPAFDHLDHSKINEDEVIPGPILGIQMVIQSLFDDEVSKEFREAYERASKEK